MSQYFVYLKDEKEWGIGVNAPSFSMDDGLKDHRISGLKWSVGSATDTSLSGDVSEQDGFWTRLKNSGGVSKTNFASAKDALLLRPETGLIPCTITVDEKDRITRFEF